MIIGKSPVWNSLDQRHLGVVFALREVVRRHRIDDLKALMGRVAFEFDPAGIRKKDRRRG